MVSGSTCAGPTVTVNGFSPAHRSLCVPDPCQVECESAGQEQLGGSGVGVVQPICGISGGRGVVVLPKRSGVLGGPHPGTQGVVVGSLGAQPRGARVFLGGIGATEVNRHPGQDGQRPAGGSVQLARMPGRLVAG